MKVKVEGTAYIQVAEPFAIEVDVSPFEDGAQEDDLIAVYYYVWDELKSRHDELLDMDIVEILEVK